jgi:hypothetical protein
MPDRSAQGESRGAICNHRGEGGWGRRHDRSRVDEVTPTGVRAGLPFGDAARALAHGR